MRWPVLLALVLAGCVAPAVEPAAAPDVPVGALPALLPPVELSYGERPTHEPSIAVDGRGTVLVAGASPFDPAPLWVSRDGGATFTLATLPDLPWGIEGQPAFAPDGDAYVVDDNAATLVVMRSQDQGASWEQRAVLSLAVPVGDRPWLAAGADGRVYVTWNQIPTGQWVAASEDGGATFPVQTLLAPDFVNTISGPLAVAPDGTVLVARAEPGGAALYASQDGARTFTRHQVWRAEGVGGWLLPTVAVDAAGNVYVTSIEMTDAGTRTRWAASTDGGVTWTPPREATLEPGVHVHAWSAAGPEGRLAIAFYENPAGEGRPDDSDGDWFLRLAVVDDAATDAPRARETRVVETPVHQGDVCTTGTQNCSALCPPIGLPCVVGREPGPAHLGDYLGVAVAPDGTVHVGYQDTVQGRNVWHARTA